MEKKRVSWRLTTCHVEFLRYSTPDASLGPSRDWVFHVPRWNSLFFNSDLVVFRSWPPAVLKGEDRGPSELDCRVVDPSSLSEQARNTINRLILMEPNTQKRGISDETVSNASPPEKSPRLVNSPMPAMNQLLSPILPN
nr:hypothetical protein F56C9.9 - Caenorhabditis elegans [Caenorhabditis elegans]